MSRLVKRYGSRKLYDTEGSQYVALDEIARWIRDGQDVRVLDNRTSEDVTVQVLGQIIVEAGKKGGAVPQKELLHELIRSGEVALTQGAQRLQDGVERVVRAGVDRLGPVRRMREETTRLRARLEELEASLSEIESDRDRPKRSK